MSTLGGAFSIGKAFVAANRPEILFGTSVVSTLGAVVMAARGGYKSGQEVLLKEQAESRILPTKEIAKLTWINYLPAAGATLGSIGSTTGLHLVHVQEKKQLAAAALIAIDQVKKEGEVLRKDITDQLGISTSDDPKDLDKAAKKSGVAKVVHRDGEIEEMWLVRDRKTGRDVYSNKLRIEEAVINLNRQLAQGEDVDLNTFYGFAGFETVPEGDDYGWNGGEAVEIQWLQGETRDDGRPTKPFAFRPEPKENYDANR